MASLLARLIINKKSITKAEKVENRWDGKKVQLQRRMERHLKSVIVKRAKLLNKIPGFIYDKNQPYKFL